VQFLIAGEGEQEPFLRKLINELGVSNVVRLLGPRTDVYDILAVSDIYPQAYAYPSGFSSISISMSGMEAMAFGLPIIASRYPALYDHIEDGQNAMIVEPRDVDKIAQALILLIKDRDMRENVGKNARLFVEKYFSLHNTIRIYESIYRALLF
jgi:glycosyltransferase involved in cell wall biosynthesis